MNKATAIPITYIERKPDSEHYRVIGKGVTVAFLSTLIDHPEWTVDHICANYNLTPAEVHAAWAFYYDHQVEIDAHLHVKEPELTLKKLLTTHGWKLVIVPGQARIIRLARMNER